ncbi:RNA polymerase sigma-70 factor (ECF subfamily) [Peptococcaceae bacterium DYL19]|nr:sigma-70 family RNA polymerase sigma factor [Phosphitispora fastidiosa]MBU7008078.1 RNA polymerase sigma-70 factor (ECF subfamily) [Phosphitispora fastidiosa]
MNTEELWAIYSSSLKTYIMKHIPDKYEAEDILQEVGIRMQKNANRIKDITNVEAWLYRIAHNLIVDYFRGANKHLLTDHINEIPVPAATEQENYNKEAAECLLKLLEYLPDTYKEAIIESDYNGKKQSLLGQKWGLSNSGSKTRIQRARKKLKKVLLSCCEVKSDNAGNIIDFYNKENDGTEFSCIKC